MPAAEFCATCGQPMHPDAAYCANCGIQRSIPADDDDPWGDRAIEADRLEQTMSERNLDRSADMGARTGAFAINLFVPSALGFIPILGPLISLGWGVTTLIKYRRGQDVGASLLKIRVMRDNGDVAGFYHMWTRNLAAILSWLVILAGFWTAYSDKRNQTWHDKIMGTYVIQDNRNAAARPGTSSSAAVTWFWISLIFGLGLIVLVIAAAF